MITIKNLKIKNKLIAIILAITILSLLAAFASIILFDKDTRIEWLERELTIISNQAADNLQVPIAFYSPDNDTELLTSLYRMGLVPDIKNVFVYGKKGQLIARYPLTPEQLEQLEQQEKIPETEQKPAPGAPYEYTMNPPQIDKDAPFSIKIVNGYFYIIQPVEVNQNRDGTLFIRASTVEVDKSIRQLIYFLVALIFILLILSVLLANKLQGIISKPILNLLNVTRQVSAQSNYSIRAEKKSTDEIGMLYDGFNQMMDQIQERDIQRNHAKNELRASKFFLSSVIDSMPSLLITIETDGKVTQWNKAAADITGITPEEAIGKNLWETKPEFREFRETIKKVTSDRKPREFYKKNIIIKNTPLYFNGSIFPLMESSDSQLVLMLNDVTDIEQKEKQLRQSQKMETVGNLAGGLAHDFNNVLGGIIGTISLFKYKMSRNKKVTLQDTEKYFNTIEDAANRASDMVKHLLSLTRKQELTFIPTDLNDTIRSIVKICNNTFDKSIDIVTTYYKEKAFSNADPTQVEQALLNLCINASHAMTLMRQEGEKFGGTLNVVLKKFKADKYFLQLHPEAEEDDYWDISVSDTGIGMDQKILSKIFDPFFTTKREGTGTGLGLAMVYNIIKQHHGFIEVYSQENIGSTFHIYLPVLKGKAIETFIEQEDDILQGEGLILVVDDEEVMRQTAKSILIECGYTVLLAENGQEALETYKKHKDEIKLVLLDMVMPKMSGKQTFMELIKINKDIKVLLVSGFKQDQRVESILKLGVKGFIQKPYNLITLANQVHHLLN